MQLTINGEITVLSESLTIEQWLRQAGQDILTVVIEHNGQIVDRDGLGQVFLQDGDNLEVLQFVGGG